MEHAAMETVQRHLLSQIMSFAERFVYLCHRLSLNEKEKRRRLQRGLAM